MGFWSRVMGNNRTSEVLRNLDRRLTRERDETARLRSQRINSIQAVRSGARAIETMGNMLKMVADE